MFNLPLYKKVVGDREWLCGTVSNGTFYWSEHNHVEIPPEAEKDNSHPFWETYYTLKDHGQYIGFTPEQASVLLSAVVENKDVVEIPEASSSVMIGVQFSKFNVEIADTIVIHEESRCSYNFHGDANNTRSETHTIPKDIFLESMDTILAKYKDVPFFNFWKDKVLANL
jgi:hypothetical protein